MKVFMYVLMLIILLGSCSYDNTKISETNIIGNWECISGCDAEIYVFSKSTKGFQFTTHYKQSIIKSGEFVLRDSLLTFIYPDGKTDIFPAELRNDSLILDKGKIVLRFFIEKTDFSNHTEELFGDLESLLEMFPDFDYTNHEPVDFTYKLKIGDDQFEEITISGFRVKTSVILAGEFLKASDVLGRITGVIIEQGFVIDNYNTTKNCSVYTEDKVVVQICSTETDTEDIAGALNVVIDFGFIDYR